MSTEGADVAQCSPIAQGDCAVTGREAKCSGEDCPGERKGDKRVACAAVIRSLVVRETECAGSPQTSLPLSNWSCVATYVMLGSQTGD